MADQLTPEAERVLRALISRLPAAVPGRPDTYVRYKEVHDMLGLQMQGPTYGESLKRQGLESLARWSFGNGFPAITGLVVDGSTLQPAEGFYRLYGRDPEDFAWWLEEIVKSKRFDWSPHQREAGSRSAGTPARLDAEFETFLAGFTRAGSYFVSNWLPRYRATVERIGKSLASGEPQEAFELIWRTQDNSVSHAGQGLLGFESVDQMSEELKQVCMDIARDSSPATFARIQETMQGWRAEKRIRRVPTLLLARAFASIAPDRYHTTVDSAKHDLGNLCAGEHAAVS